MIELDGSAGGGQLVRSALALSALAGEPFRIEDVRGGRPDPGLRPQHLAAVRTLAAICDAEVEGASVGSGTLSFRPRGLRPGRHEAEIGTAGSLTLLFDALLALSVGLDGPLSVTARGGTDVKWSPPLAYYRRVKLPLLRRHGVAAAVDPGRTGFYPAGGGEATLYVYPSSPSPISLPDRGAFAGARVYSKASDDLAGREVAERQATAAADRLEEAGFGVVERRAASVEADSTGSAVVVRLDYGGSIAGFDALGERGTPAEEVGERAADAAVAFDGGSAAVDRHMADQLVVPLALAGGRVAIPAVTDHVEASRDLVCAFGLSVGVEEGDDGRVHVVGPER